MQNKVQPFYWHKLISWKILLRAAARPVPGKQRQGSFNLDRSTPGSSDNLGRGRGCPRTHRHAIATRGEAATLAVNVFVAFIFAHIGTVVRVQAPPFKLAARIVAIAVALRLNGRHFWIRTRRRTMNISQTIKQRSPSSCDFLSVNLTYIGHSHVHLPAAMTTSRRTAAEERSLCEGFIGQFFFRWQRMADEYWYRW